MYATWRKTIIFQGKDFNTKKRKGHSNLNQVKIKIN